MSNTPKWETWCKVKGEISKLREKMISHQKQIIGLVQEDMNTPGKDKTNEILEREIDLETLKNDLKPLEKAISKIGETND